MATSVGTTVTEHQDNLGLDFSFSHTVDANTDLLIVAVHYKLLETTKGVTAVDWDGASLTEHQDFTTTNPNDESIQVWILTSPTAKTANINVTTSGGTSVVQCGAINAIDVDTSTPIQHTETAQGGSSPATDDITAVADGMVFAFVTNSGGNQGDDTPGSGQTETYDIDDDPNNIGANCSHESGSGTITMDLTLAGSFADWGQVTISLNPGAAAGGTTKTVTLADQLDASDAVDVNRVWTMDL